MNSVARGALASSVAVTIGAALLLLSVALTGEELSFEAAVRSCFRSGGVLLAVGVFALVTGLLVALKSTPSASEPSRRGRWRS